MEILRHYGDVPPALRGSVLAIGNFDGVHLGHRAVMAEAAGIARAEGRPWGVLAFEPHPRQLFRPDDPPFRLTTFRRRAELIAGLGADLHVVLGFDRAMASMSAEAFMSEVLVGGLGVGRVVVGADFCFGRGRSGNAMTLEEAGRRLGFAVTALEKIGDGGAAGGAIHSSERVRALLRAGRPEEAAVALGRLWDIEGRVEKGDQRGRQLGYPTANVPLGDHLVPALGVYAVRATLDDPASPDAWIDGVANLGIRPMWQLERPLLEVHLFDFAGDLYGRHLRVQLVGHLRAEAHFGSVEALVRQMDEDSAGARRRLAAIPPGFAGCETAEAADAR